MTRGAYNGYDAGAREAARQWLKAEQRAGRRERPAVCCACGQDRGIIDAHSESYAQPFGEHVGRFPLCYTCHMMVHARHGNPVAWNVYRTRVRRGWRYPPAHRRQFERVVLPILRRRGVPGCTLHDAPPWPVLDEIHAGAYREGAAR